MKQNGFAYTTLILTVLVIIAATFGWYYYKYSNGDISFITDFFQTTQQPNTTGWKNFNDPAVGISFQYPPSWYDYNDQYISKYPYSPTIQNPGDIYDAIMPGKITSQVHLGYNNDTFFNHLYSLGINGTFENEFYSSDQTIYTVLLKGKLRTGQKFVVYKADNGNVSYSADILEGVTYYNLSLISPDDEGIKTFEDIVKTTTIN